MCNSDQIPNSEIYFTIIPTRNCGFTDKLNQFIALYRLGISLGYTYHHTDLRSHRSKYNALDSKPTFTSKIMKKCQVAYRLFRRKFNLFYGFNIFNFLGFNQYFCANSNSLNFQYIEKVKLKIDNELLEHNNIKTLSDFSSYIKSFVQKKKCKKILVLFTVIDGRNFVKIIHSKLPRSRAENELREKYFELRQNHGWISRFIKDKKFKILVHVRQGDTSVIKTPWNTYIPVFGLYHYVEDSFGELEDINQLKTHFNIGINEYFRFIKKLSSEYKEDTFSFLVFSDGFKRGFSNIYRNFDLLNLTQSQKNMLKKSEKDYDSKTFGIFNKIRGVNIFVGEDNNKLKELIHAVFDADIIIIGNHQAMIPKFLSVYFDMESMPIVLVLYKRSLPRYSYIKQEILDKKFVFIDVENPDYSEVLKIIHLKISGSLQ